MSRSLAHGTGSVAAASDVSAANDTAEAAPGALAAAPPPTPPPPPSRGRKWSGVLPPPRAALTRCPPSRRQWAPARNLRRRRRREHRAHPPPHCRGVCPPPARWPARQRSSPPARTAIAGARRRGAAHLSAGAQNQAVGVAPTTPHPVIYTAGGGLAPTPVAPCPLTRDDRRADGPLSALLPLPMTGVGRVRGAKPLRGSAAAAAARPVAWVGGLGGEGSVSAVEGPVAGRELGEEGGGEGGWVVVIGWLVVAGKEGGTGIPKFAWVTGCLTRGQREAQGSGRCGGGEGDVARAAAGGRLEQSTEERGGWHSGDVQRQRRGQHAGTEVGAAVTIAGVSDRCGAASMCQAEGGKSTLGRGGGGG